MAECMGARAFLDGYGEKRDGRNGDITQTQNCQDVMHAIGSQKCRQTRKKRGQRAKQRPRKGLSRWRSNSLSLSLYFSSEKMDAGQLSQPIWASIKRPAKKAVTVCRCICQRNRATPFFLCAVCSIYFFASLLWRLWCGIKVKTPHGRNGKRDTEQGAALPLWANATGRGKRDKKKGGDADSSVPGAAIRAHTLFARDVRARQRRA